MQGEQKSQATSSAETHEVRTYLVGISAASRDGISDEPLNQHMHRSATPTFSSHKFALHVS